MCSRISIAITLGALAGGSNAALVDRGSGLLYDDILNVTWLQDASVERRSGQNTGGFGSLAEASYWAADFEYFDSVRNVTWTDWRLPKATPVHGNSFKFEIAYDGSTDNSFNIRGTTSELAFMFYSNLGLSGYRSISGDIQLPFGIASTFSFPYPGYETYVDIGLAQHVRNYTYWSLGIGESLGQAAVVFSFDTGLQGTTSANIGFGTQEPGISAWLVRDGDVSPVPEINIMKFWLIGGCAMALLMRRRTYSKSDA